MRVRGYSRPMRDVGPYMSPRFGECREVMDEDGKGRFFPLDRLGPLCGVCTTEIDTGRRRLREGCATCAELSALFADRRAPAV